MSLLTIIQRTAVLLSIPSPSVVVGSSDSQVQQLFGLANEEGEELAKSHDWQALKRQQTFLALAQEEQTGVVPSDLDHFISNSFYNRTTQREVIGPITPQLWQAIEAQPQLNRVFLAFRMRDNSFLITPTPSADETVAYEYVTLNWATAANGDEKAEFDADTDTTSLSERLIRLGVRWRFLKSKGLNYSEDFDTYQRALQIEQARDGGSTKLNFTGANYYNVLVNLPEGNWPG